MNVTSCTTSSSYYYYESCGEAEEEAEEAKEAEEEVLKAASACTYTSSSGSSAVGPGDTYNHSDYFFDMSKFPLNIHSCALITIISASAFTCAAFSYFREGFHSFSVFFHLPFAHSIPAPIP